VGQFSYDSGIFEQSLRDLFWDASVSYSFVLLFGGILVGIACSVYIFFWSKTNFVTPLRNMQLQLNSVGKNDDIVDDDEEYLVEDEDAEKTAAEDEFNLTGARNSLVTVKL
jgi:hypothetical protein